MRDRQTR